MKVYGFAALAALLSAPAIAEPTIDDACAKVAGFQFNVSDATATDVQSFPELTPPRVRMRILSREAGAGSEDAVAALLNRRSAGQADQEPRDFGMVFCEFQNTAAPFNLTAFDCAGTSCFVTSQRLEELQALLRREGY